MTKSLLLGRSAKRGKQSKIASSHGVTLTEWLIAIVILGIISSLAIGQSLSILRRERINSVAVSLAGWIEEVRNLSLKEVTGARTSGTVGCLITFESAKSASRGDSLAQVNSDCSPKDNGDTSRSAIVNNITVGQFRIPSGFAGSVSYSYSQNKLSGVPTITYTPRGIWLPSSGASGDLIIKLFLAGGGPMRCLRISETLAFVDIGSVITNDSSASCDNADYVRF
mgnify:CR=1 FL=1